MSAPHVHEFLSRLENVKAAGTDKWLACCPGHDDQKQSLSLGIGQEDKIVLNCFASAGCTWESILAAMGLPPSALFPPKVQVGKWEEIKGTRCLVETYPYQNADGSLLFQVRRFTYREKNTVTGEERADKTFLQRQPDGGGGWLNSTKGIEPVLYRLPALLEAKERGDTIFLVEGEKDVHTLEAWGLTATTVVGGAKQTTNSWKPQYTETLSGANVVILPDNDTIGKQAAQNAANELQGKAASIRVIFLPQLPHKGDVTDWKEAGGTKDGLLLLSLAMPEFGGTKEEPDAEEEGKTTTAAKLLRIALSAEYFRSDLGDPFAFLPHDGHHEVWAVRSKGFKEWLAYRYYQNYGKTPGSQALEDTRQVLEGKCRFEGKEYLLSLRTAQEDKQTVWIDLGDTDWHGVRVTPSGWDIEPLNSPLFRRYSVGFPHKTPQRGGSLKAFGDFLNVRDEGAWMQLVAWLVCSLLPDVAHPILVIHGEMGTAKTTLMKMVSRLIDPSRSEVRSEPKDAKDWIQMASHAWLVCLDNLSSLPPWFSDALCRAVTGEADVRRQLYTDDDDVITAFRRCIALTGIEVVTKRPDLLQRALLLPLDPIPAHKRRSETEVMEAFEAVRPMLFGALLDVLSGVLRVLPSVRLETLPRMADFARVGVAVGRVLGWQEGAFLSAYTANLSTQHEEALDASPIGDALQVLMNGREATETQVGWEPLERWEGKPSKLLEELTQIVGERMANTRSFPKAANKLSGELKRLAPNLRAIGLLVEFSKGQERKILLSRIPQDKEGNLSSLSSLPSPDPFDEIENGAKSETIEISVSSQAAISIVSTVAERLETAAESEEEDAWDR